MMNLALYKREMKGSIRLLIIFGAVITMYVSIIISNIKVRLVSLKSDYKYSKR